MATEWIARIDRAPGGTFDLTMDPGNGLMPNQKNGLSRREVIRDIVVTADGDHVTVVGPKPQAARRLPSESAGAWRASPSSDRLAPHCPTCPTAMARGVCVHARTTHGGRSEG